MKTNNHRRRAAALACALTLALVLSGCGSGSKTAATSGAGEYAMRGSSSQAAAFDSALTQEFGMGTPAEAPAAPSGAADNYLTALDSRKVVRHSNLELETMEFDSSLKAIAGAIAEAGGYVQSQNLDGESMYYSGQYYERSAQIYARIPADRLDEVTSKVGALCNVVSQSETMDDITDSYMDTSARLATLKIQEERLLAILEKAEKLEDVITLESALSDVRYEIESLTSALNRMDSQVTYSFLNISLREVVEYKIQKAQPKNFIERLGESFGRSMENLSGTLEGLLFFVIEDGPVLLVYAAFILVLVLLGRRAYRAWRKKHPDRAQPQTPWAGWHPGQTSKEAQEEPYKEEK